MKILVVDDTATDRKILEKYLKDAGHEVLLAEDGQKGIAMAKLHKPDAIFMDVVMTNMDGFKATREITRQGSETSHIPVFMVSTKSRETDVDWATDNGARGYLFKPAKRDEVLALLQRTA